MPPSSPRRQSRSRPRSRRRTAPPRSSVSPSRCRSEQTQKPMFPPERIVCLTEETVETLYLLGEERRIVGVSGYAVRPARVRREKPRISAFISADFEKILALEPDLVLAFSDLQADIAAELIRRNVAVHAFNQRDIAGILDMIRTLGALVGAAARADALAVNLERRLGEARERAGALKRRPRVYFEEWDEPMISGIRWVTELIEIAGGIDVFPALSRRKNAKDRIVSAEHLIAANPDIIVGSWCGKKFVPAKVAARPGFADVAAVRDGFLREIKSPLILQPGPAALTEGLDALAGIIEEWAATRSPRGRNSAGDDFALRGRGSGASAKRDRSPGRGLRRWRDQDHHRPSLGQGQHGARCDERGQEPRNKLQLHRQRRLRIPHANRRCCQRGRRRIQEKLAAVGQYELCRQKLRRV